MAFQWNRGVFPFVVILLLLHGCLLAWGDFQHSPTVDEVGHLPAGLSHWQLNRFELYRVNPPLVRLVASFPVLCMGPELDWSKVSGKYRKNLHFEIGTRFISENGSKSFLYFSV